MSWSLSAEITDSQISPLTQEQRSAVERQNPAAVDQATFVWDAATSLIDSGALGETKDFVFGIACSGHVPEPNNVGTPSIYISIARRPA